MPNPKNQPANLEQYVANRYVHELNTLGYQPQHTPATEMLDDALAVMAALNKASQFMKQNTIQRRQAEA